VEPRQISVFGNIVEARANLTWDRRLMTSDAENTSLGAWTGSPERPIDRASEDRLQRSAFVRHLISALIDARMSKSRGVVIGITGPWGSGKTSVLNLLRESLRNTYPQAIVVAFDPWLISGRNDLISEFIKELISTIESKPEWQKTFENLSRTITQYGKMLAPAASVVSHAQLDNATRWVRVVACGRVVQLSR
jgi:hypothetical protein